MKKIKVDKRKSTENQIKSITNRVEQELGALYAQYNGVNWNQVPGYPKGKIEALNLVLEALEKVVE